MVNRQKQKGTQWERDLVKLLGEIIPSSNWKRMPTSGAMGTILKEPTLGGDISGTIEFLPRSVRAEAKVGYGGEKQMSLKREWFTKIREEANRTYSIPVVFGKFSGSRGESKYFAAVDFETLTLLANMYNDLYTKYVSLLESVEMTKAENKYDDK